MYDEGGLTEAELFEERQSARRALDEMTHLTAEVIVDLQDRGPLYKYALDLRTEAIDAIIAMVFADPRETAQIIQLQAQIGAYFDLCKWIKTTIEQGTAISEQVSREKEYESGQRYEPD
jgi:hypothetical protein